MSENGVSVLPPIWLTVSDERSTLTLVVTDDAMPIDLPVLTPPFTVASVKATIAEAHLDHVYRVIPGRRSEETRRVRQAVATESRMRADMNAAIMATSNNALVRSRAEAITARTKIDEELRGLKLQLADAKAKVAIEGVYADRAWYLKTEERIVVLKGESLAMQSTIGRLRDEEREQNRSKHESRDEHFRKAAYEILTKEQFGAIEAAAEEAWLETGNE